MTAISRLRRRGRVAKPARAVRIVASTCVLALCSAVPTACGTAETARPSASLVTRLDLAAPPARPTTGRTPDDAGGAPGAAPTPAGGAGTDLPGSARTLLAGLPAGSAVRLMALGDSLTRGDGPADPTRPQSYRGFLLRLLADAGARVDAVGSDRTPTEGGADPDNEGHGGFTIGPDRSRLCAGCDTANLSDHAAAWLAANPADVILLLAGVNDLLPIATPTATGLVRPVDPAQAAPKLLALVEQLQALAPHAVVLVASQPPMPFVHADASLRAAYDALNRAAADAAARGGGRVLHVALTERLAASWNPSTDSQADGLHPSAAGAAKIAGVFFEVLGALLAQPGR